MNVFGNHYSAYNIKPNWRVRNATIEVGTVYKWENKGRKESVLLRDR